jgi:hypothetical protein
LPCVLDPESDAVVPYDLAKQPRPPGDGSSHRKGEHIKPTPNAARFVRSDLAGRVILLPFRAQEKIRLTVAARALRFPGRGFSRHPSRDRR